MTKFFKTSQILLALVWLTLIAASPLARASILGNGQTGPPSFLIPNGTTLASETETITTITFSATYTTSVISDLNNTFCSGCLDFTYTFTNNGPDVLEHFTGYDFAGFMVDAGFNPTTAGNAPLDVYRASTGAVVGFDYTGVDDVKPGQTTPMLIIETNARSFTTGYATAQDGNAGYNFAYAPASTVPEPSSLGLIGGGLLVLGGFLRRFARI